VPDASLTAAAKAMPESKRALGALREFTGRASRTELDRWWAAIEAGRQTDDMPVLRGNGDTLPPPRAWSDRNPEADARLKGARAALTLVSEERAIPLENLLTPETLRRVAWTPPADITPDSIGDALRAHGARPWQVDATSQPIAQAFVESTQSADEGSEPDS
jgi:ribonuclease D